MRYDWLWQLSLGVIALLLAPPLSTRAEDSKKTYDLKPVTHERLLKGTEDSSAWLMYGGNYQGWRFSPLKDVNRQNVKKLAPIWIFQTGAVVWNSKVEDYANGYSVTVAPLVVKDKVVLGIAGGDYGARGYIDAYDVKTGERKWRRYTVPGAGEKGNETWPGDAWKSGGGPAWITGSYDAEQNLIFWATGNPGPDW